MKKTGKERPEGSSEGHGIAQSREHVSRRPHCVARKHAPGGLHTAYSETLGFWRVCIQKLGLGLPWRRCRYPLPIIQSRGEFSGRKQEPRGLSWVEEEPCLLPTSLLGLHFETQGSGYSKMGWESTEINSSPTYFRQQDQMKNINESTEDTYAFLSYSPWRKWTLTIIKYLLFVIVWGGGVLWIAYSG